jgi:selenocysteine-specific elongation factor
MTRRLVFGVIGHVDHGKSELVRALTGMETDRLAEEKRRGISIALGFAHFRKGDVELDLIDMPGHERFVRTMIAGASGVDAALLVVAANEGVKPQTIEHVEIAALLGLRRAVVAVSKVDLVSTDGAILVGHEAISLIASAGLTSPPPLMTSARTGAGISALADALANVASPRERAADSGFCHLPIDRAFSMPGHGTIVTGTLRHGAIAVGDELDLAGHGGLAHKVRVRGLQVHGAAVMRADPGQRVAVNLRSVDPKEVARGMALVTPGLMRASEWMTVALAIAPSAPRPLRTTSLLRLFYGTSETEARLRLLDRDEAAPGERCLAQLHCASHALVAARDHVILRLASPPLTVAGGVVVEPETRRLRRHDPAILTRLRSLTDEDPAETVSLEVEAAGRSGCSLQWLARLTGQAPTRVAAIAQERRLVVCRPGIVLSQASQNAIAAEILQLLSGSTGDLSREQLRLRLTPPPAPEVLSETLRRLEAAGKVREAHGRVGMVSPAREASIAREEEYLARCLADAARSAGYAAPEQKDLLKLDPRARRIMAGLLREGVLVCAIDRVQNRSYVFHQSALQAARQALAPHLAPPGLLVREAAAVLGVSRKYAVPLLEYLAAIHFTRRVEDRRVLVRPP